MWECQRDSAMESAHCLPKEAPASDGGVEEQYEVEEGMAYTQEIGISGKSLNSEGQTRKNLPRRNHRGVFCGKPRTPKRFRKSETRRDILPSHSLPITARLHQALQSKTAKPCVGGCEGLCASYGSGGIPYTSARLKRGVGAFVSRYRGKRFCR